MTKDCAVSLLLSSLQEGKISTYRKAGELTKDCAVSLLQAVCGRAGAQPTGRC